MLAGGREGKMEILLTKENLDETGLQGRAKNYSSYCARFDYPHWMFVPTVGD
jgi:hypothetical protein